MQPLVARFLLLITHCQRVALGCQQVAGGVVWKTRNYCCTATQILAECLGWTGEVKSR